MRKIFLFLSFAALLAACGGSNKTNNSTPSFDLGARIEAREKTLDMNQPNPAAVNELIGLYVRYADSLPEDKKSPVYLLKASDLYHIQGKYALKCEIYQKIISKFPNFKDLDMVMYLYASSLDSELDMRPRAKEQYQAYIETFPKSQYVTDARERLKTIDTLSFKQLEEHITKLILQKSH